MKKQDSEDKKAAKERDMSDKPRPWPNQAKEARDRSAEEAQAIVKVLLPVLNGNAEDVTRRVALALLRAQQILRLMEAQGAPTRAEYEEL